MDPWSIKENNQESTTEIPDLRKISNSKRNGNPKTELVDPVEDYYTLDKENAFKLLAETKLDSTSEKSLNLVRYYELL